MSDDNDEEGSGNDEVEEVEEGPEETEAEETTESVDESSESEEAVESEEQEGLQSGDFIRIEYTVTAIGEEDERVVDTTDRELAEEEGMETEDREFGARTVALGEDHLFGEVEEDIVGEGVGYSNTVVISAEDAFGEHDPEEVETVSAKKIPEDDRYPGAQVQIDGKQGYVETIIGGRARVDFNHPLAGQDIRYEFEVVDVVGDRLEQAESLIEMYAGTDVDVSEGTEKKTETRVEEDDEGEETTVEEEVEVDVLYIEAPSRLSMNQNWVMMKGQIANDLMDRFEVDRVVVRETFDDEPAQGMGGMGLEGLGDVEGVDEEELEELVEGGDLDELEAELGEAEAETEE